MAAWILLGVAGALLAFAAGLLIRGALSRVPRKWRRLHITRRRDHANGWLTLILQRPWYLRALPLRRFTGGQSIAIALPERARHRRYSLARWSALPFQYEITVKPEPRGIFSNQLASQAQERSWLEVGLPSGSFVLPTRNAPRRAVLIAGGVGITPLLAMVDQWLQRPGCVDEVHLYWQVRHEHEWIYREALHETMRRDPRLRLRLLASRPNGAGAGSAERVSAALIKRDLGDFADVQFLLCAGHALVEDLRAGLLAHGVAASRIGVEHFSVGSPALDGAEWQVDIAGERVAFAGHPSLLSALEDGGVRVAADCRAGSCGQCRLNLLAGQVHQVLQAEFSVPTGQVLACCCVPKSDVRLSAPIVD